MATIIASGSDDLPSGLLVQTPSMHREGIGQHAACHLPPSRIPVKLGAGGKGVAQRYHFTSGLAKACYQVLSMLHHLAGKHGGLEQ
jgi:hypothetical protein